MEQLKLKVKKLHKDAQLPSKAHETDSCYDLYAVKDTKIPSSGGCGYVSTGIALGLPKGYGAKISGRSGFSHDQKCTIGAGEIDNEYTGEVKVLVFNFSAYPLVVTKGTKFAQFKLQRVIQAEVVEVDSLDDTTRGDKGFGSSGQ